MAGESNLIRFAEWRRRFREWQRRHPFCDIWSEAYQVFLYERKTGDKYECKN